MPALQSFGGLSKRDWSGLWPVPLRKMTGRGQPGGERIIGGGVQNRYGRGVLWYVFPSPEFSRPCLSLSEVSLVNVVRGASRAGSQKWGTSLACSNQASCFKPSCCEGQVDSRPATFSNPQPLACTCVTMEPFFLWAFIVPQFYCIFASKPVNGEIVL